VDEKGRLKIPSAFLGDLRASGGDFYVTSENGDRVLLYPMKAWNEIEEKVAKLPSQNPAKRKYLERTSYFGARATIDKQGRILIHPRLREAADMKGEVDVLGSQNHLEIWNHSRFLSHMDRNPMTAEDATTLSDLGI
jgi:MraZ protein